MIRKIIKRNFLAKVAVAIVIGIIIPTVFIGVSYYILSANILKKNVRTSSLQIIQQAADSISFALITGSDMADLLYSHKNLHEMVMMDHDKSANPEIKEANNRNITAYLNSQVYSNSFVKMVYILKREKMSWGSGSFSPLNIGRYKWLDFTWALTAEEADGDLVWEGLQNDAFSGSGYDGDLILPVVRVMKNLNTMENIGFIFVALDGERIVEKIGKIKLGQTGKFFVVDEQGKIMIDSDLRNINQIISNEDLHRNIIEEDGYEFEFQEGKDNYYGVKYPLENGWMIVGVVPIHEITGELLRVQHITILAAIIFAVLAVLIGIILARKITNPIKQLTEEMRLVGQGNFQIQTTVHSDDEIGHLSHQFNQMIFQVNQLMEKVKEEEKQKIDAELRAIKHRINPHFLFNTLSTIQWLLQFNQIPKATKALTALSLLLEANMAKDGTFLPLKEEINIVKRFLEILEIRYDQSFQLTIEVEESLQQFLIPRMLLQPIVENAVFHGIVPKQVSGEITITGKEINNDGIVIVIQDNGVGFNQEKLNGISDDNLNKISYLGLGLTHVYESVRLYYSSKSHVDIKSQRGIGTKIIITLYPENGGNKNV